MSVPLIRPATAADLAQFYPEAPRFTVKAWVADIDGRMVGLGGVAYPPPPAMAFLFSEAKPELLKHPRVVLRAVRHFLDTFGGAPLCAFADPQHPGAVRFLTHLGFRFVVGSPQGDVYRWRGSERRAA